MHKVHTRICACIHTRGHARVGTCIFPPMLPFASKTAENLTSILPFIPPIKGKKNEKLPKRPNAI